MSPQQKLPAGSTSPRPLPRLPVGSVGMHVRRGDKVKTEMSKVELR